MCMALSLFDSEIMGFSSAPWASEPLCCDGNSHLFRINAKDSTRTDGVRACLRVCMCACVFGGVCARKNACEQMCIEAECQG